MYALKAICTPPVNLNVYISEHSSNTDRAIFCAGQRRHGRRRRFNRFTRESMSSSDSSSGKSSDSESENESSEKVLVPKRSTTMAEERQHGRRRRFNRFRKESLSASDSSSGVSSDSDSGPEHEDTTCYGPTDTCLSVKLESEPAYTALLERNNEMAEVSCDMSDRTLLDNDVANDSESVELKKVELSDTFIDPLESDLQLSSSDSDSDSDSSSSSSSDSESSSSSSCSCSECDTSSGSDTSSVDWEFDHDTDREIDVATEGNPCPKSCLCRSKQRRKIQIPKMRREMRVSVPLHTKLMKQLLLRYENWAWNKCCPNECDRRWARSKQPARSLGRDYK